MIIDVVFKKVEDRNQRELEYVTIMEEKNIVTGDTNKNIIMFVSDGVCHFSLFIC